MYSYSDRNRVLLELGFPSYSDYLKSPLWDTIRREVLKRDNLQCRVVSCSAQSLRKHVHHLNYARETLLGVGCFSVITLCERCHRLCEFTGDTKLSLNDSLFKTLRLVAGLNLQSGRSERKAGYWFRNQRQASRKTAQRIMYQLLRKAPDWYETILADLRTGRLPKTYARYLGLVVAGP